MGALLELADVDARYGPVQALRHVSLTVGEGEIVALLGAENQSCPVLAIDAGSATDLRLVKLSTDGRYALIQNADEIGRYLSSRYGTPRPH